MKRVLFDTDVVLDVLVDWQPYVEASAAAWAAIETGLSEGMLAAARGHDDPLPGPKRKG